MEPPWLALATELTGDPIMMDGFLEYYEDRPEGSPLRKRLEETLFNEQALRPHLTGEPGLFRRLLNTLPPSSFASYSDLLAERFPEEAGKGTNPICRVLSVIAPERAAKLFASFVEDASPTDTQAHRQIAETLLLLPKPAASSLLEQILSRIPSSEVFLSLLRVAFHFEHAKTPEVLAAIMNADEEGGDFGSIASILLDHDAWFDLFSEIRSGRVFSFSEVAGLFEDDAPFSEMDRILLSDSPLNEAIALLEKHAHLSAGPQEILKSLPKDRSSLSETIVEPMVALILAAVAHVFEHKTLDTRNLSLEETIALLITDISRNRHVEALSEHLKKFPAIEVLHAIEGEIGRGRDLYGGFFLVQAMGLLAREEFIPLLISCMDDSSGDALSEAATRALIAIGETAGNTLMTEWNTLDSSQQIYGSSVILSVGGKDLPDFLLAHIEDLYEESMEQWCDMALAAADQRFLSHLKSELKRKNPFVNVAYYRLCRLFGVEDTELPKIREGIEEEQKRIEKVFSRDSSEIFLYPEKSSLTVSLRCQSCGKSNSYSVNRVFIGDKGDAPLISGEFVCLSCDRWSEFDFDSNGIFCLTAEMMRISMAHESGVRITPLVDVLNTVTSDGLTEPLPKAFRRVMERIRENPGDWRSLHRLSNLLIALDRPRAAFDCTARAYELNPDCLEIVINRILSLRKRGMEQEAFALAQDALENRSRWMFVSPSMKTRHQEFEDLYNELISSLDLDLPEIRLVAQALPSSLGWNKVGRNDPCPCGSGKKYKKCCL
jgi:tetratricopeptide (TPR) repeat protein